MELPWLKNFTKFKKDYWHYGCIKNYSKTVIIVCHRLEVPDYIYCVWSARNSDRLDQYWLNMLPEDFYDEFQDLKLCRTLKCFIHDIKLDMFSPKIPVYDKYKTYLLSKDVFYEMDIKNLWTRTPKRKISADR